VLRFVNTGIQEMFAYIAEQGLEAYLSDSPSEYKPKPTTGIDIMPAQDDVSITKSSCLG